MAKTPDTHTTEPLDKITFGKRYYVIDDSRHVWGADLDYDAAVRTREKVAGSLWSKTPAVREMPQDPKVAAKIKRLVRGPDGVSPPVAPQTQEAAAALESDLAEMPEMPMPQTPIPPASSNGTGEHAAEIEGDDDELGDLLDA